MAARKKSAQNTSRPKINIKQRRAEIFSIWIKAIHKALGERGIEVAERKMNILIREMHARDSDLSQRSKAAIEKDFRTYFEGIKKTRSEQE